MTPAELETQARARYNADGDPHFTSLELRSAMYQAELELALEASVIEATTTVSSTTNTQTVTFPTNCIGIRRIEYDGQKLNPASVDDDPKNSTTEVYGTPAEYSIWNDTIYLYPTPQDSQSVKIFYYKAPDQLTASSTVMSVPARYHTDILDMVLSVMYAKDQNTNMSSYHRNLWESNLNKIKRSRRKEKRGDQFQVVAEYGTDRSTGGYRY